MTSKPFSETQFRQDDDAKIQVGKFVAKYWDFNNVRVNPNKYGIDLLCDDQGTETGIEVEVKHNWIGNKFPFNTVHFSARKVKFLEECKQTFFVMLNHERDRMIVIDGSHFHETRLVCKNTVSTNNEWFIQVPLERFTTYHI